MSSCVLPTAHSHTNTTGEKYNSSSEGEFPIQSDSSSRSTDTYQEERNHSKHTRQHGTGMAHCDCDLRLLLLLLPLQPMSDERALKRKVSPHFRIFAICPSSNSVRSLACSARSLSLTGSIQEESPNRERNLCIGISRVRVRLHMYGHGRSRSSRTAAYGSICKQWCSIYTRSEICTRTLSSEKENGKIERLQQRSNHRHIGDQRCQVIFRNSWCF